jgi:adenosylcobinamide-GDP ribazoletransferase
LAAFIAIAALPLAGFLLWAIIAVAAVFLLTHLAKRQIGGYTGDVMGASQQVTEMIGFVVLSGFLNAG